MTSYYCHVFYFLVNSESILLEKGRSNKYHLIGNGLSSPKKSSSQVIPTPRAINGLFFNHSIRNYFFFFQFCLRLAKQLKLFKKVTISVRVVFFFIKFQFCVCQKISISTGLTFEQDTKE